MSIEASQPFQASFFFRIVEVVDITPAMPNFEAEGNEVRH